MRRGIIDRVRASALCERAHPLRSAWDVIGWWEARRVSFNLIVGSAGIISSAVVCVVGLGSYFLFNGDFGLPDPPLFAVFFVVLYAVAANVCYTAGWVGELVVRAAWPGQADRFATLSLTLAVLFSVLVTLLPGVVAGAAGIFGLLGHLLGVVHS